jgi:polyphenol oxidase
MSLPPLVTSGLLPVPHGFSTRAGGFSTGPYASLNLGFSVGDDPAVVEQNLRHVATLLDVSPSRLHTVSQVHGDVVLEPSPTQGLEPASLAPVTGEADALRTSMLGSAVGVKTADCVPILLVDPPTRQVAAVHSGWKGTDLDIVTRAVDQMKARGAVPSTLLAAVGPCIRACCYEVSPELAERFSAKFGPEVLRAGRKERSHLDLVAVIRARLSAAGLSESQVDVLPHCTACEAESFFSHRRDGGVTGRHLSVVVCRF